MTDLKLIHLLTYQLSLMHHVFHMAKTWRALRRHSAPCGTGLEAVAISCLKQKGSTPNHTPKPLKIPWRWLSWGWIWSLEPGLYSLIPCFLREQLYRSLTPSRDQPRGRLLQDFPIFHPC